MSEDLLSAPPDANEADLLLQLSAEIFCESHYQQEIPVDGADARAAAALSGMLPQVEDDKLPLWTVFVVWKAMKGRTATGWQGRLLAACHLEMHTMHCMCAASAPSPCQRLAWDNAVRGLGNSQASGACLRATASGHQRRGTTALFTPLVVGDQIPRGQATVRPAPPACALAVLCASHGRTSHHTLAPHACAIGCRASPRSCPLRVDLPPHRCARNVASCWKESWRDPPGRHAGEHAGEKRRASAGDVLGRRAESRRRAGDGPEMAGEKWRADRCVCCIVVLEQAGRCAGTRQSGLYRRSVPAGPWLCAGFVPSGTYQACVF